MQHPRLHMSDAWSYCYSFIEISGALYHLELTWPDILLYFCLTPSFISITFLLIIFLIYLSVWSFFKLYLRMESRILLELPEPFPVRLSGKLLDIPKSHIFTWQSLFIKRLAGLKSRCTTLAEWQ